MGEETTPETLDAIRRRVLNVIGHELRTPVSTIRGLAETMEAVDDLVLRREVVPALLRSARRLEALLDEMLMASSITTALPVEPPGPRDVAAAARAAWGKLGHGDGLLVEGEGQAAISGTALAGIFERLLDNAAKYGEGEPAVRVATEGERVTVEVDTAGPDIHPEEVALATEAFFRGERAVMTAPGMGLGLAVAKALAEQVGGRLEVSARPGGGLVTRLDLPAATA